MDSVEALHILGLQPGADAVAIDMAFAAQASKLVERASNAPTAALKTKYERNLAVLRDAHAALRSAGVANTSIGVKVPSPAPPIPQAARTSAFPSIPEGSPLSRTQMFDLPGAAPSFTRFDSQVTGQPSAGGPSLLQPGTVIDERYEVRQQIGAGGMGAVFEAYDRVKGEAIAIKVLLPGLVANGAARDRFLTEAKLSCKLSHPNIVNVFDVHTSSGFDYLTMELLQGETLRESIEVRKAARSPFTAVEAIRIGRAVADALHYAHEHMVHRDIKPENIWICEDGTVKLMDFGIVRMLNRATMTKTSVAMGTAYYMAPEQLVGASQVDHRADQYSLGIVLYEMLANQLPTGAAAALRKIRKDIPGGLSDAVMKAIATPVEQRFPDMHAFSQALARKHADLPWKSIGVGAAAVAALALIVATYPTWSSWLSFGERAATLQANAIRNQGAADLLQKRLDKLATEIDQRAQQATQAVDRLKQQQTMARDAQTRADLDAQIADAQEVADNRQTIRDLARTHVFESDALLSAQGLFELARAQVREGSWSSAAESTEQLRSEFQRLIDTAGAIETTLQSRARFDKAIVAWGNLGERLGRDFAPAANVMEARDEAEALMRDGAFLEAAERWSKAAGNLDLQVSTLRDDVVPQLLTEAKDAESKNRLAEPKANNALDRYRMILQIESANSEAQQGLRRIGEAYEKRADASIRQAAFDRAEREARLAAELLGNPQIGDDLVARAGRARIEHRAQQERLRVENERLAEQQRREQAEAARLAEERRITMEREQAEATRIARINSCQSSCEAARSTCSARANRNQCELRTGVCVAASAISGYAAIRGGGTSDASMQMGQTCIENAQREHQSCLLRQQGEMQQCSQTAQFCVSRCS